MTTIRSSGAPLGAIEDRSRGISTPVGGTYPPIHGVTSPQRGLVTPTPRDNPSGYPVGEEGKWCEVTAKVDNSPY